MSNQERIVSTNYVTEASTGEILDVQQIYKSQEPQYVKLYLDCMLTLKGVSKCLNPILAAMLKQMTYANESIGQVITLTSFLKSSIADSLNLSEKRINQALTEFVKAGLFKRVARCTYQVNPNIIGKGEWKDIKRIRATFDFNTQEIIADIIRGDEDEDTTGND